MANKAGEEELSNLHGLLANEFARRIREGSASPSDLNAARQFLKDNNISCDGPRNPVMKSIADDLPDFLPDLTQ